MTNDKQVEVWRNQFLCWFNVSHGFKGFHHMEGDSFRSREVEIAWRSWVEAKRSMPPIELPRSNWNPVLMGHFYSHGEVVKAITAAGYSYRVKE